MSLLAPTPTPYDPLVWDRLPFPEKARLVCQAWSLQGYGTPLAAYALYVLKIGLYVGLWCLFVSATPGLGDPRELRSWWLEPIAFHKAILWSMLFEIAGLGCGSGPLTGRYHPPIGGLTYFLRPGTTKRPLFPGLPLIGGHTRGALDVLGYGALLVLLLRALLSPALTPELLVPIAVLLPLLGVLDRTLFLAARAEHYYTTLLCFVLVADPIPGAKAVQLALWFWAGVSKLNHHFPAVVCVMISNSPVTRWAWLRRRMYRDHPHDLRPSRLAVIMAHMGTLLELGVPLVLVLGDGGTTTTVGLVMMLLLHGFITSCVPMGVPLEWNVMVVYGGYYLCGAHAGVSILDVGSPLLAVILVVALILVPLVGNLRPRWVSFLLSMRYYAGNWAYSVWLFQGDAHTKLERLTKSAPWIFEQLDRYYDRATSVGLVGKVIGFRAMHLHGRALHELLPRAVGRVEDYTYVDGELVAGLVLGWNFGDGHLHDEGLLRAVQAQCGFAPGELRVIMVESQPLLGTGLSWRIADAATGPIDAGEIDTPTLRSRQPWPA